MFGREFEKQKEYSLFSILRAIVPKQLKQDFHITIFFNNDPDKINGLQPLAKDKAIALIDEIRA